MTLQPRRSFKARSCVVSFLLALSAYCAATEAQAQIPARIQTAAEMKTRAEESAAHLKQAYRNKKVSEKNYARARSLYVDARAAIDGWVAALATEIEQGRDPAKVEGYSESLKRAAAKAETFIEYVQGLLTEAPRAGTPIVGDLIKALGDSGIQIWKEYRSVGQKQKESLVKRLESLKWKPFDEA